MIDAGEVHRDSVAGLDPLDASVERLESTNARLTMARLHDVVFDCRHPASLARFWAAVLDGYAVAPYDDAELERLREQGINDVEDDPVVMVAGPGARLCFQLVPESKVVKNRVHLDLAGDAAEIQRFVELGATVTSQRDTWYVLTAPKGNEFCVSAP